MSLNNEIIVRPIRSFSEKVNAWGLVYKKYFEVGFIPFNSSGLHFSLIDLLPQNVTFVAYYRGKLVGTLSIIIYSAAGLPCGRDYDYDLLSLGIDGQLICEFSKLAQDDSLGLGSKIACELGAAAFLWCIEHKIDDVFCVCHPRHATVWAATFGLNTIGKVKCHSGVNDNPGVLMHYNLAHKNKFSDFPARGQRFLKQMKLHSASWVQAFRLSGCEAIMLILQRPELMLNSTLHARTSFEKHYPYAFHILQPYLHLVSGATSSSRPIEQPRPIREREFRFANDIVLSRPSESDNLEYRDHFDHLLVPDRPLVLFLSEAKRYSGISHQLLGTEEFIVIAPDNPRAALELVSANLFDLILINGKLEQDSLSAFIDSVRARDKLLSLHTPIVHFNNSERRARDLVFYAEEDLLNELALIKLIHAIIVKVSALNIENEGKVLAVRA